MASLRALPLLCLLCAGLSAEDVPSAEGVPSAELLEEHAQESASGRWSRQLQELEKFSVVVPRLVSDRHKRYLDPSSDEGHPDSTKFEIEIEGETLVLELEKNENLISPAFDVTYYLPNGTRVTQKPKDLEHCYYHGRVQGQPDSDVSLSTCAGLRGYVNARNVSYGVEPLEGSLRGGAPVSELQHVVYRAEHMRMPPGGCGLHLFFPHGDLNGTEHGGFPQHLRRKKRNVLNETKYVELMVIGDNREFQSQSHDVERVKRRVLDLANNMDGYYKPLNVRIALVGVEVWNVRDLIVRDYSASDTLSRFLEWRMTNLLPRKHNDNAHLLTGGVFSDSAIGMAPVSTMCTKDRSGGISIDHSTSALAVASTMAHEVGHNLGMNHDMPERGCVCSASANKGGCIMEPASGFTPGQVFSTCSRKDLQGSLQQGVGMCLFNVPGPGDLYGGPRCGNQYVEVGEQCDCGTVQECNNVCCDASTCMLKKGAQCAEGLCCKDCQILSEHTLCRGIMGECDLAEYCDGINPNCPGNVFLKSGSPCQGGAAFCYTGICNTLAEQCQQLWGSESEPAEDLCYQVVNDNGDKFGNCGRDKSGAYVACLTANIMCGKLLCRGGTGQPIVGWDMQIIDTSITIGNVQHKCRGTYFNLGSDVPDPGYVLSGTKCGEDKACLNQECQKVSVFGVQACNNYCGGHGVCNNNNNCHCDAGWAPPNCSSPGNGGSLDGGSPWSPTPPSSNAGKVALLVIFLLVVPLLACGVVLCYCYREALKKSWQSGRKPRAQTYSDCARDSHEVQKMTDLEAQELEGDSEAGNGGDAGHGGRVQQTELHTARPALSPTRPKPPTKPLPSGGHDQNSTTNEPPYKPPPPQKPLPSNPARRPVMLSQTKIPSGPSYVAQPVVEVTPSRPPPPAPKSKPSSNVRA
ncbi:disintegrin and metalloproteinase domain-containing protein 12-like isoform X1 [Lethenteron reissneri]|uniref:disintegrin and metalloproteinase domain-containing protein 12-like isoform X1 n=1 Tax=Lethenteron reissneri TaxID=7753 RepID=UPI002AB698AE|nr:disintegrin and metalloproteinase domain-containing protein 12-like isoform X1 [Lethenteron reissneri]